MYDLNSHRAEIASTSGHTLVDRRLARNSFRCLGACVTCHNENNLLFLEASLHSGPFVLPFITLLLQSMRNIRRAPPTKTTKVAKARAGDRNKYKIRSQASNTISSLTH